MAEAAAGGAADKSGGGPEKTIVYAASGGRKTIFSFVFLILLPFYVSLPAMLFMRIKHGLFFDAIGLAIMAVAFSILMLLVVIELLASIRMRVELGPDKVKMTLPSGRGPTPMLFYKSYQVPYDQVQSVETRREIYGGSLVPVLLKGARIVTKDGKSIPIGYISETNVDPAFPFPEIAKKIAERARLPLIDRGNVRRSFRRKYFGFKSGGVNEVDTVDETQIAALNKSHHNVVMGLVSALVVLIGIGVVSDLMGDTPIGQTASAISTTPAKAPAKK
jgi:cation transporter-like permease